jgi:hypothetical protein
MSNYLAIATVTAALQDLLQAAVGVPGAVVTTQRPEAASNGAQNDPKINLYMYQVMPNAAWRNHEITIRRADPNESADRSKDKLEYRPLVPLNLHYLISFYGAESELQPQRLLGSAVGVLQANARLPIAVVRSAIENRSYLRESNLPFQLEHIEHVQLTPIKLDLEEMSKVWSVFFQVPYSLSIAYEASVVLIEPGAPRLVPVVSDPQAALKQLKGVYLFSIELKYQSELEQETASDALIEAFKAHTFRLSRQATIRALAPGHQWYVEEPERKTVFDQVQRYRVARGETTLDIYDATAE